MLAKGGTRYGDTLALLVVGIVLSTVGIIGLGLVSRRAKRRRMMGLGSTAWKVMAVLAVASGTGFAYLLRGPRLMDRLFEIF